MIQSPAAVGGAVYASTATHLAAVDATSGSVLWTRALPSGYVLACAAATGQPRWSVRTGSYVSPLAAADGRVIAGGWTVQAFAEASGAVAWTSTVHGAIAVTISGVGVTYLTELDSGTVFMNRLPDGHLLAAIGHPGGYYNQLGTPVAVDGHIYLFTQRGSASNIDRWSTAS